jgi:hypothetical protein
MSADRTGRAEMGKNIIFTLLIDSNIFIVAFYVLFIVILTGNSYPELAENISR